jgi:ATP-binding cassette subfamily F protein uup
MHLITLESIEKNYPETTVLTGASLAVSTGQRIGLIGQNGSGKSTLLGIMDGTIEHDGGTVVRASNLTIATLNQNPVHASGATVGDVVSDNRSAIALADRLGLVDTARPIDSLSGGQRKRLSLAAALATECDLLILDEPTNHLDIDTIDWLEDHLATITSALILVTHDRYLLDRVVDTIAEVFDGKVWSHPGSYAKYLEARETREALRSADAQRRRQRIRTELAWLGRNPKARTSKSRHRTNKAVELVEQGVPRSRPELVISLPGRRIGSKVVNLHNAGKSYDDHVVLRSVTHLLAPDARIGVVGPNGAGKTTLLSLIARRLEPDTGKVVMGPTIVPGWYGQDPTPIPPHTRLIDAVREHGEHVVLTDRKPATAAKLLEMFQFSHEQQQSTVGDLSGGERRRLELLMVLMEAPNLLLLDEPTNDLDLDTLHALEDYLDEWSGAMVVASHDRYFLDRVCHDIFSIEGDGSIRHHPGGWSDYWLSHNSGRVQASPHPPEEAAPRPKPARTKLTYNDHRELNALSKRLDGLERDRRTLTEALAEATGDVERVTTIGSDLTEVIAQLEQAETRWLELTELAERLAAGNVSSDPADI